MRDPKLMYLMLDADFTDYWSKVRQLNEAKGLKTENPDHCPLLVAENLQTKAERALIDAVEPVTGLKADDVLSSKNALENYKKLIDLTLRWIAPFANPKVAR